MEFITPKYKIEEKLDGYYIKEYDPDINFWFTRAYAFTLWGAKLELKRIIKNTKYKNTSYYYTSDGRLIK